MAETTDPEDRRAALHAYEHARDATRARPHRVDLIDEPQLDYGAPRRLPMPASMRWVPLRSRRVDHSLVDPATTAFKAGFGFAAGAAVFRFAAAAGLLLVFFVLIAASASALLE